MNGPLTRNKERNKKFVKYLIYLKLRLIFFSNQWYDICDLWAFNQKIEFDLFTIDILYIYVYVYVKLHLLGGRFIFMEQNSQKYFLIVHINYLRGRPDRVNFERG